MKKSIAAPLCSGLVVPGLGQILNRQVKKGLILLGLVFVLFIAGAVKFAFIITSITAAHDLAEVSQKVVVSGSDLFVMAGIAVAFVILWIYSVVDAFWVAFQSEQSARSTGPQ
jgi:TM2 domain-containing membrane protein YozV